MAKGLKQIPSFASETDERDWWERHDSTPYLDWREAARVKFPNLRRSLAPTGTQTDQG